MRRAASDGADEVIFFVNSPIERLTNNHKTHLDKHQIFRENIKRRTILRLPNTVPMLPSILSARAYQ